MLNHKAFRSGTDAIETSRESARDREIRAVLAGPDTTQEVVTLRRTVDALERVIGILAHDLRTPLTAIQATSQYLLCEHDEEPDQAEELLRLIHGEALRMNRFVDNVLVASRLNSGVEMWDWGHVHIGPVCETAVDTIRPLLQPGVVIRVQSATPAIMLGDADAIQRLLLNLLHNAVKHTAAGEIVVRLEEVFGPDDHHILIQISDTGEGMPPHVAERLGQPFSLNGGVIQGQHGGGSGLGIAICQGIAAAHGGRLAVESDPGSGTTVNVYLRENLYCPAPVHPAQYPGRLASLK